MSRSLSFWQVQSSTFKDSNHLLLILALLTIGHETTALLLTWCMYLLARHQTWQDKLRDEVFKCVGPSGDIRDEHLSSFKEMNLVLLETLRLFPPVPVMTRITDKVTTLGFFIFDCT